MPNGSNHPESRDLWIVVNEMREDVAEMKAMLKLHLGDPATHHHPPCLQVQEVQRTILAAAGSALLALLAAVGSIVASILD
ncbi:MAG: hypothetical protein KBA95_19055 [Acidobacteria bacterium]|nr:hypothetical protein [Acidobacteriota bacterium]